MTAPQQTLFAPTLKHWVSLCECVCVSVYSIFPPEQTAAASFPLFFSRLVPLTVLVGPFGGYKTLHFAATPVSLSLSFSFSLTLSFSLSLPYMILNNLMLQLSSGQVSNPCFFLLSLSKRLVDFLATDQGSVPSLLHVWRGEKEGRKEGSKLGMSASLKSLVASPLHWLPRDQQGAKSTQGRQKWKVFTEGRKD